MAMKNMGHTFGTVFNRYKTINVEDLMEASRKVVHLHEQHVAIPGPGHVVDTSPKNNV